MAEDNKFESKILPLLAAGSIKYPEEYAKVYINCNPEASDGGTASSGRGLKVSSLNVIFPEAAKDKEKVPLIGGSIVKIALGSESKINTNISKALSRYETSRLKSYIKKAVPDISTTENSVSISRLVGARRTLNKVLHNMPSLTTDWHDSGVPSLVLSKMKSEDVTNAAALQAKIDPKQKDALRVSDLEPVGTFKFIPPQILKKILDALVNDGDDDFGMKEYAGISGEFFSTLADYLAGEKDGEFELFDDDAVIKVLLDIFPILHVEPEYIDGEELKPDIGYFTAHKDSLYIKMPDLSGRDSDGDSLNIYSLGEDDTEAIVFCFELLKGNTEYAAIAFDHQAPPVLEVLDGEGKYPESTYDFSEITISKEGLDASNIANYKFFLSPIIPTTAPTKISGFEISDRGVEMFTAPIITQPYLDPEAGKPVASYSNEEVQPIFEALLKYVKSKSLDVFDKTALEAYASAPESAIKNNYFFLSAFNNFKFEDLGLPLSVPLSSIGVNSVGDALGEHNRPEILLDDRGVIGATDVNNSKFYDPKVAGAKVLLTSNRPNIIIDTDFQIPQLWIPLDRVASDEDPDNEWVLKAPHRSSGATMGAASGLDIYNESGHLSFALYVVDDLGQIVRAPGENISIAPNTPMIESVTPSGFKDDGSVITGATALTMATTSGDEPGELGGGAFSGLATGLQIKGEGFGTANESKVHTVNFYLNKEGTDLAGYIKESASASGSGMTLSILGGGGSTYWSLATPTSFSIISESPISDIVGNNVGEYFVGIELSNGFVTPTLVPFYVAGDGTTRTELPEKTAQEMVFQDPFGFTVHKFGNAVHSIPIIMDATNNAKITIKSKKRVFGDTKFYAYIAVAKEGDNLNILKEDIGWEYGDHKNGSIITTKIKTSLSEAAEFYVPTNLEWEFNSDSFRKVNARKIQLDFPGSDNVTLNLSRFADLEGPAKEYPAYILFSSKKLSEGAAPSSFSSKKQDYAVIPIGDKGSKKSSEVRPFIMPPNVFGCVVELPAEGGETRTESNVPKVSLTRADNELKKHIKKIDLNAIKSSTEQNYSLISSNALDRLAVVFRGPKEPNLTKLYSIKIGKKSLKPYRVNMKYAKNNLIVANYKDISDITDEGWIDVVVTKKDKRFGVTYDSVLYNKVTTTFDGEEIVDESITKEEGDNTVLASDEDKLIPVISDSKYSNYDGDIIFPGGNGAFSPLPILKDISYISSDDATDAKSYYHFANPVKIKPSVDLIFGSQEGSGDSVKIYGMALSDSPVDEKGMPGDEIIGINTLGKASVELNIADMAEALKRAKEEAAKVLENIKSEMAKLDEASDEFKELSDKLNSAETNYNEQAEAATAAVENAEQAEANAEQAKADALAQASAAGGGTDGGASGFGEAAAGVAQDAMDAMDSVVGVAQDALSAINDALGMLQTITDTLSSIADIANQLAEGVEGAISSLGARPDDFIKANIKHIYIDKNANIPPSDIQAKDDNTEFKLVTTYKFEQNAAIKFNVPEIVEIRVREKDGDPYLPFGERPFSSIIAKGGDNLYVKVIGANKDTKFEVGGKRVEARRDSPFSEGIYQNFIIKIPDMSAYSIFGTGDCISLSATNSNENRMRLGRQMGNDLTIDLEDKWNDKIFGGGRNKQGPSKELQKELEMFFLKFTSVTLDKANIAKEFMQSFCDFSFHLTAELSLQLRNFKVLLIPIKVIFCIIDVICALLHPIRLAFAIIRLFLCLYDLILLLPQLSVPAMYLALLLHLLELLLCVIMKILGIINAINEIITALVNAVEQRNFPAVAALEEALNEHLFSLEADLSVLEPIITILALFLELLQLIFAFPCQVGADEDDEACIDPSQLAGLIIGKVAPNGRIEPDALLPLAQSYTRLPLMDRTEDWVIPGANVGKLGNTPPSGGTRGAWPDDGTEFDYEHVLEEASENNGKIVVDTSSPSWGGAFDEDRALPGLKDSLTGDNIIANAGEGFFAGDNTDNNQHDNVSYQTLRFNGGDFDATFGLSFTKSTKKFSLLTGPDPRIVKFEFNGKGVTNQLAFVDFFLISMFFRKKVIDELQTTDSPPIFLDSDGTTLSVGGDGFVSPVDGFTDYLNGNTPKPLTVTFDLQEPGVDPETMSAKFTPVEVTKTFGNIPMIALVDDEFNVYFIEEGGIEISDGIASITAKMINHPSAPKKKTSREDREVFKFFSAKSDIVEAACGTSSGTLASDEEDIWPWTADYKADGEKVVQAQANANFLKGLIPSEATAYAPDSDDQGKALLWEGGASMSFNTGAETYTFVDPTLPPDPAANQIDETELDNIPYPDLGYAYDFASGHTKELNDLGSALDSIKAYDFPRLYIVDMRHVAQDIAAACGASGPMELLLDLPGFEEPFEDNIDEMKDCLEEFLNHFNLEDLGDDGIPLGLIPRIRHYLANGELPPKASVTDIIAKYETLKECVEDQIDKSCKFVINPLNTGFKLLDDDDETPLAGYVDPEQKDLQALIDYDIVDELEFDDALDGFPSITGAMEYASGIGDLVIKEVEQKAFIEIVPRDCYDDPISMALDLTDKIKIEFVKDETGNADLVEVIEDSGDLIDKDDSKYTMAVMSDAPGKVVIKATICGVVIQAVTDRGIINTSEIAEEESLEGCVPDASEEDGGDEVFAPGALMKVDRTLTILFVPKKSAGSAGLYGDADRDGSAKSAKPEPQAHGTKLEN
jgi:hypothetical protein